MYSNSFLNPYIYQPYYQTTNLTRGLGNIGSISNINNANNLSSTIAKAGLGKGLLSKFNFSNFLNGASKTLNVVNQAIPIFYQVRPIINNAKTMFRIMGAVKDDNTPKNNIKTQTDYNNSSTINTNTKINSNNTHKLSTNYTSYQEENPTFFI